MAEQQKAASIWKLPFTYWISIVFEFFERGAYYGVMSVLSVYLTEQLYFSKQSVGIIKSTIQPILYFLPILTGAIADKLGYRKTLLVAFGLLGLGYMLTSQATEYAVVFFFLIIMALGAGTFKPVISGTIAKVTDESTSTQAFGVFYWTINMGAFIFPTFLVPWLKGIDWSYILIAAAICTGAMIIPTFFIYKEPARDKEIKKEPFDVVIKDIFKKVGIVILDWRFILFILIYSWFWIMYFQMFDSALWYFKMFVDPSPIRDLFGINFAEEHVTSVNAATIILLQFFVSYIVRKTKALPTMITGISLGIIGIVIIASSQSFWFFFFGLVVFSLGEMTAHPKYISYLGLIAPKDKKATYMGFGFLYGFFGSFVAGFLGANLYVKFIDNPMIAFIQSKIGGTNVSIANNPTIEQAMTAAQSAGIEKSQVLTYGDPTTFWLIIAGIGVMCIIGLLAYHKFIGTREASDLN